MVVAGGAFSGALSLLGIVDVTQTRNTLRRNYPGHQRISATSSNTSGRCCASTSSNPTPRKCRSRTCSARSSTSAPKNVAGQAPVRHRTGPVRDAVRVDQPFAGAGEDRQRTISASRSAAPQCTQPYSASVFNISAMSFGALSANAIRALNEGARRGGFYHDTGEGSLSRYHRENRRRHLLGNRLGLLRLPQCRRQFQRRALRRECAYRRR